HRHPRKQNFRKAVSRCVNKCRCGNYCRRHVADSGQKADDWIETEAKLRSGKTQEIIHDEREPPEKRLERSALLSNFWRENFPIPRFRSRSVRLRSLSFRAGLDRKSTRLNSSHQIISYAV